MTIFTAAAGLVIASVVVAGVTAPWWQGSADNARSLRWQSLHHASAVQRCTRSQLRRTCRASFK